MAEGTEIDDQVDLDDDNYSEEIDDDLDDQLDYDAAEERENDNGEDQQEEEDSSSDDSEIERSPEANRNKVDRAEAERSDHLAIDHTEDEKPPASINEDDKDKYAELLALPPRGSEVFVGGFPRDVSEEDLRDLFEPFGEILEVSSTSKVQKNENFPGFSYPQTIFLNLRFLSFECAKMVFLYFSVSNFFSPRNASVDFSM